MAVRYTTAAIRPTSMRARMETSSTGISIWLLNIVLAAALFVAPDNLRPPWTLPPVLGFFLGFALLDAISYWIHRAQHAVPFLWRFHAMHHSDPDVDLTTAVRHHPIEFLISTGLFWATVMALGIPGIVVLAHGTTTFVLAVATHGNVRWPSRIERLLRPVIITLDLHLVHHSTAASSYNANFGAVFSFWDRLFGTLHPAIEVDRFGVDDLPAERCLGVIDQLATPWRLRRASPAAWQSSADVARREIERHRLRYWEMF